MLARVIDQGSRLSAVRLAQAHGACEILEKKNKYLEEHPRSYVEVAARDADELCKKTAHQRLG